MHLGNFNVGLLYYSLYFGLFGLFARYCHSNMPRWNVLTFPAIWMLLEYLREHIGFLSFPWGTLGYSQYTVLPVAQLSAWTGVYGVSFLIVAVNTVVAEVLSVLLSVPSRRDLWIVLARRRLAFSCQLLS